MFVILDTTRYGTDPTDEQIADSAERYGLFATRDDAVQTACELSVPFNKLVLVEIVCEEGRVQ